MSKITVHFIRHGLTKGNIKGAFIGWTDILLTEKGRDELKQLKRQYRYPAVDQVFSSPLVRARETADIFYPEQEPVLVPGFKEVYFGECEAMNTRDIADVIDIYAYLHHEMNCSFPGGESVLEARFRVMGAMTHVICQCIQKGYQSVAIFAHGSIIRTLMEACLETEEDMSNFIVTPNGMGLTAEADTEEWFKDQKLHFVNYLPEGAERPPLESYSFYKILKEKEQDEKTVDEGSRDHKPKA